MATLKIGYCQMKMTALTDLKLADDMRILANPECNNII